MSFKSIDAAHHSAELSIEECQKWPKNGYWSTQRCEKLKLEAYLLSHCVEQSNLASCGEFGFMNKEHIMNDRYYIIHSQANEKFSCRRKLSVKRQAFINKRLVTCVKSIEIESGASHLPAGEASVSNAKRLYQRVERGFY